MPLNNVIKNALISVSDKTHILNMSKILIKNKINLIATEGTAKILQENNIPVMEISEYTKFPSIMDGRIKTLHPKIMAGILQRNNKDKDIMKLYNFSSIDIIIVNFYPFEEVRNMKNNHIDDIIKNIDIGGPTLVRAAAKNYQNVIVIVDFDDFQNTIDSITNNTMNIEKRFYLATKAFEYTAYYESMIAQYFTNNNTIKQYHTEHLFPKKIHFSFIKKQDLRYGENQHQKASFYIENNILESGTISASHQIQGKTLSYNNISDSNTALECVKSFEKPACVIVKHENPCGVAVSHSLATSYLSAYYADSISAFGGIVAFNVVLDEDTATKIITTKQFIEVIIAPDITVTALKILKDKPNIRILITGAIQKNNIQIDFKKVINGLLVQEYDSQKIDVKKWSFVTKRIPTQKQIEDAIFCWKVAKFVKSNAIVYGHNQVTISIGAGQMSRIDATKLANIKMQDKSKKITSATMASDAFFPFRDGIDNASLVGINCIIQPGGSIRDKEIIEAANEKNMVMIFTNQRHFKH